MKGRNNMKKYVLPTICVDEVKFCNEGKFFFAKYEESNSTHILSKFTFDEVLYGLTKQGFEIINKDGSLYDIEQGA